MNRVAASISSPRLRSTERSAEHGKELAGFAVATRGGRAALIRRNVNPTVLWQWISESVFITADTPMPTHRLSLEAIEAVPATSKRPSVARRGRRPSAGRSRNCLRRIRRQLDLSNHPFRASKCVKRSFFPGLRRLWPGLGLSGRKILHGVARRSGAERHSRSSHWSSGLLARRAPRRRPSENDCRMQ